MNTTLLVVLIVGGNLLIQGVVWFFVIRMIRRRNALLAALAKDLAASGETVELGPVVLMVRRGHLASSAGVMLTERRLIIVGSAQEDIARSAIRSVSTARSFNGKFSGGRSFVIIEITDGRPVALHVKLGSEAHWKAMLEKRAA